MARHPTESTPESDEPTARAAPARADAYATARDTCYQLLGIRQRSRQELRNALLRKGIDEETADDVLTRFATANLVDDEAFAASWVQSRYEHSGKSRAAVAAELRGKGVDTELAASAVAAIDDDAEAVRARALVRKKITAVDPAALDAAELAKLVRRLVGVLARKGYGRTLCLRVVRDELRAAGASADVLEYGDGGF